MPTRASCVQGWSGSPRATERSTSSTPARARASACACGSAARGASRPCAAPIGATPRLRSRARSPIAEAQPAVPDGDAAGTRAAGAGRVVERRWSAIRSRFRSRRSSRSCSPPTTGAARRADGVEPHARPLLGVRDRQGLRLDRGRALRAADHRVRRRHRARWRCDGDEPDPLLSRLPRRPRGPGGIRALPRSRACRGTRRGWPPRRWRCSARRPARRGARR